MGKRLKVMTKQGKREEHQDLDHVNVCFTQVFKHLTLQPFLIQLDWTSRIISCVENKHR